MAGDEYANSCIFVVYFCCCEEEKGAWLDVVVGKEARKVCCAIARHHM